VELVDKGERYRNDEASGREGPLIIGVPGDGQRPAPRLKSLRDITIPAPASAEAQDYILGYSQLSLRDWSVLSNPTQDSRPGLLSAVPAGLVRACQILPRTYVLGYSQPFPSTSSGQALRD
jgi:hypothetical protein